MQQGVQAPTIHTKLAKQKRVGAFNNGKKHHKLLSGILNVTKLSFFKCAFLSPRAQKWCRSSKGTPLKAEFSHSSSQVTPESRKDL